MESRDRARPRRAARRMVVLGAVLAVLSALGVQVASAPANADNDADAAVGAASAAQTSTAGIATASVSAAEEPSTVTADALPTAQMNGVAWDQEIVGDVVYVVGSFSSARPAGAAAGTNETPRSNVMAYRLSTGELISSFAPSVNAQVRSVDASPDGSTLYIVGDFTSVNGQARNRVAAFDVATGQLTAFNPNANGTVIGVDSTNSTVYITGNFGRVGNQDRLGAAAVTKDGALTPWAPVLGERRGRTVLVSPDESKVVLGGDFPTLNGSSNPGYGLAMVSAADASLITPFQVNDVVRNAGNNAAILSLKSDGDSFYGTGYVFGAGGNLEGSFRADWNTGKLMWVNDCHGDEYDVQPMGQTIYAAGHSHYCGSLENGFPQSDPWIFYRAIAVTKDVARITPSGLNLGYFDFGGNPAPALKHWFPTFNSGTVTGQYQGPWSVSGNSEYLVYGGEFTRVNNTAQQGLTRFAVPKKATNAQGPVMAGNAWSIATRSMGGGVRVSWPVNYDRDSENLTYEVLRDNQVVATFEDVRSKSPDWGLPPMAYVDSEVEAGRTYSYRVRAKDAEGHAASSSAVSATAAAAGAPSAYRSAVLEDSPVSYWPLDDQDPGVSYDWAGASDLAVGSAVTRGVGGAIQDESTTAAGFSGGSQGYASTTNAIAGPGSFGVEGWFRTTSTSGGKIIGFGNSKSGNSSSYDRHVYMEPNGTVTFGVYPGSSQTISSSDALNDGEWHHVAAGMDADGMVMFIDGKRVAQRTDVTTAQAYNGYWRIGGDSSWSGSDRFVGDIDEVAVYSSPLSKAQVAAHYQASGRTLDAAQAPDDAYGASVFSLDPDVYWRLGESNGSTARDSSGYGHPGTYSGAVELGREGALDGVSDTAAEFSSGQVIGQKPVTNPRTYSLEAWFSTSSTTGGKIIGFGNSSSGNSSSYDRHVYMTNDGHLVFGVYTGVEQRLTTDSAFNDGKWHHVVATQGADGMKLYVDGELTDTNTETGAQNYTGYWHVGGDVSWGPGDNEFDGTIDEVAVYPRPISATDVAQHYSLGVDGQPANSLPVAGFTATSSKLTVGVDGSESTDADGTIEQYDWDWGDDTPIEHGAEAEHTFAEPGTYSVTLTVTDDRGGSDSLTQLIQVIGNQAPTASFTTTTDDLDVAVDGTASEDVDGTIEHVSWEWGDGSEDEGDLTAAHTYAEAGTYTVKLTVTDDDGESSSRSEDVTVSAPTGTAQYARDDFGRTLASGLGSADDGGAWTLSNSASNYRVDGSRGVFVQPAGGSQRFATLGGVSAKDVEVRTDVAFPSLPGGASAYSTVHARGTGSADYRARLIVSPSGSASVQLMQTSTVLTNVTSALTLSNGDLVHVRFQVEGSSPTTLRVKVWKDGTDEPESWTSTATDSSSSLQGGGSVGLGVYMGGSATKLPFQTEFDNFRATAIGADDPEEPEEPENEAPKAAFSSSVSDLSVDVDASESADADGSIESYEWDFGDGESGSGKTASHEFAEAGTYEVSLTVTDDDGATDSVSHEVEVSAPEEPEEPENEAPKAAFSSSVSDLSVDVDASESADADGSIESYEWDFGDGESGSGKTASHEFAEAGTYEVSLTVTDDDGATDSVSHEVEVSAPDDPEEDGPVAEDDFERANGTLGDAVTGGAWTQTNGAGNVGVDDGRARLTSQTTGQTRSATLRDASSPSADQTFTFEISENVTSGRMYVTALGRVVGSSDYRARWLIDPDGKVQAQVAQGSNVLAWSNLSGITVEPGAEYHVRVQVFGADGTTVRSKIWEDGQDEPQAWQVSAKDSTAALQAPGYTGVSTYSSGTFGPVPYNVFIDDYRVSEVQQ